MVDGHLSTKFGVNLLHGYQENGFYRLTTGAWRTEMDGRWLDARVMTVVLLCNSTIQS